MNKRNELAQRAHSNAAAKGFYNNYLSTEHYLMLIVSEVSELVEADRKGLYAKAFLYDLKTSEILDDYGWAHKKCFEECLKDTKEDEFADIAIRLYDLAGSLNVELSEKTELLHPSPLAHSFTENAYKLVRALVVNTAGSRSISWALNYIHEWAECENIKLDYFIEQKMKYNETREPLHGKKY